MTKSPDAFRTISEVADWLGIQAHVLRFWESKFTQVKPIKRAGGRRYYRPADMRLLGGIKRLLHDDGLTIKGVQKLLREEGVSHVASLSEPLDELTMSQFDDAPQEARTVKVQEPEEEVGVVLPFEAGTPAPQTDDDIKKTSEPFESEQEIQISRTDDLEPESAEAAEPEKQLEDSVPAAASLEAENDAGREDTDLDDAGQDETGIEDIDLDEDMGIEDADPGQTRLEPERIEISLTSRASAPAPVGKDEVPEAAAAPAAPEPTEAVPEAAQTAEPPSPDPTDLPAFLRNPMSDDDPELTDNPPADERVTTSISDQAPPAPAAPDAVMPEEPAAPPPAPKPRRIDMPTVTPEAEISAIPAALSAAMRAKSLSPDQASKVRPLLAQLAALRDSMASNRKRGAGAPGSD